MDNISFNDLVNQLADLQCAGSLAIIGANANKIIDILGEKWKISTNNQNYYIDNNLEAITSSEKKKIGNTS